MNDNDEKNDDKLTTQKKAADNFHKDYDGTFEEMSQVEAADILVERMKDINSMDFVEKQLNLWLISILDLELQNKKKQYHQSHTGGSTVRSINNFNLGFLEKINLESWFVKNNINFSEKDISMLFESQMTMPKKSKVAQRHEGNRKTSAKSPPRKFVVSFASDKDQLTVACDKDPVTVASDKDIKDIASDKKIA